MDRVKHTSGPFRTTVMKSGYYQLIYAEGGNGSLFAELDPKNHSHETVVANAAFIVRACNTHYRFLVICKQAGLMFQSAVSSLEKEGNKKGAADCKGAAEECLKLINEAESE